MANQARVDAEGTDVSLFKDFDAAGGDVGQPDPPIVRDANAFDEAGIFELRQRSGGKEGAR